MLARRSQRHHSRKVLWLERQVHLKHENCSRIIHWNWWDLNHRYQLRHSRNYHFRPIPRRDHRTDLLRLVSFHSWKVNRMNIKRVVCHQFLTLLSQVNREIRAAWHCWLMQFQHSWSSLELMALHFPLPLLQSVMDRQTLDYFSNVGSRNPKRWMSQPLVMMTSLQLVSDKSRRRILKAAIAIRKLKAIKSSKRKNHKSIK